nr:MAG TPA: hypothetical protein [Caudoviricetes sp.]
MVNISFTPCVLLPDMLYLRHKEGNRKRLPDYNVKLLCNSRHYSQ